MNLDLLIPLLITSVVAILGWFIGHRLTSDRDRVNKQRDLRIQYLIDAWRKLEHASNRNDNSQSGDIENAIADIQLFGSRKQIELAHKFVDDFVKNGSSSLDELLEDLRLDLRKELQLEDVGKNIKYLRFISEPEQKSKPQ